MSDRSDEIETDEYRRKLHELVDRLIDGPEAWPELDGLDDLEVIGKFIWHAGAWIDEFIGRKLAPEDASREERIAMGDAFINGLTAKRLMDKDYPAQEVRAALLELLERWCGDLRILSPLYMALQHLNLGHVVTLLAPPKSPLRPPERALQRCELQAELLGCLRFREIISKKRRIKLNETRSNFARLVGRDVKTILDWRPVVRQALRPWELDQTLKMAELRAAEVLSSGKRDLQEVTQYASDAHVAQLAADLHKLMKEAKSGRKTTNKKRTKSSI